jgi:formate dehydrogenase
MLNVGFAERLVDEAAVARWATGVEELASAVAAITPERTAAITGIDPDTVRELARSFASAPSAVAYARLGLGRNPMAATSLFLMDCLNVVTGNFDRRGGWVFGQGAIEWSDMADRMGSDDWGRFRSRVGQLKDVTRRLPWVLPEEIVTPGDGQVRAMFVSAGNPVVTAPDGDALDRGLSELELLVCIDLFANETTQKADFVLPVTTFLERRDMPLMLMGFMLRPWVQATKAVVTPPPEVREEWWIFRELGKRLGIDATFTKNDPQGVADELLRRSVFAADLGICDVESPLVHLENTYPHGIQVRDTIPVGLAESRITHPDKKVHIGGAEILEPLERLSEIGPANPDEMSLIGRRDLRSINSWMHAKPERGPGLYVHPADADRLGVADGDRVRITRGDKHLEVPVEITDRVMPGVVSYPHGWDARRTGGVNINRLLSSAVADKDSVSGASHLDGVPVIVERGTPAPVTPSAPLTR